MAIPRAIDTNVIARFLLNDDAAQSAVATRMLADGAVVPVTVLLELSWLLRSRIGLDRATIAETLLELLDLPSITIERIDRVRWALQRYAQRGDLADLVHIATCGEVDGFATFDRGVAPAAGSDSPVPIETLS